MKSKTHNGNGYTSENGGCGGGGSNSSPSPPPSPRRNSGVLRLRRRLRSGKALSAGIVTRRSLRYFFLLPLVYISGLLMCVGPFPFIGHAPLPGSRYRSHEIFHKLWHDIDSDNSSAIELSSVWKYKRKLREQKPCPNLTTLHREHFVSPGLNGFLIVEANGGLNQQRSAICNAVALAGLLNAILVIPHFEFHNVWKDPRRVFA